MAIEKTTMRKVYLRLLPFAVFSYILAYIDRINVSFAGLTMRSDLKLSATEFGFALGTFFLGYFLFEVPSNVIMAKVGARIWMARIMITWGIFAGVMAFVYDTTSFSIVRFLLGVAEAGFFPGMLFYFTYWFPRRHHARIVSGFLAGLPVAVALGAPISTGLLSLDGLFGLKGWQIMYIAEAIPTVLIGIVTLFALTDHPEQARFLTDEEKRWLTAKLASERPPTKEAGKLGFWKVQVLILMYVAITVVSLGCCTTRSKSPRGSTLTSGTCLLLWSSSFPTSSAPSACWSGVA
jgi:ACS family tartrate transporter-like MFS transporter